MKEKSIGYILNNKNKLIYLLIIITGIIIILSPVLFREGWPENHEGLRFYNRTNVWAQNIKNGNIIPVWSGSDLYDHGAPMPLYYQKLYYYLSAFLLLVFSNLKIATVISLAILMLIGSVGIRKTISYLTDNNIILIIIPLAFLFSNYVFTDWLVRGAMAEFSAMMLVPWMFWWSIKLIKTGYYSIHIAPIFVLLFYAHNAIALVSIIILVIAFIFYLFSIKFNYKILLKQGRAILISVVVVLLFIIPTLLMQRMMDNDYSPSNKINDGYSIKDGFREPIKYIYDFDYSWMSDYRGYTVQINLLVTILFIFCLVVLIINFKRLEKKNERLFIYLITLLTIYIFLQLEVSSWIYAMFTVLSYIQFPWRMLTVITPLLLLIITQGLDFIAKHLARRLFTIITIAWLVLLILSSPLFVKNNLDYLVEYKQGDTYEGGEYTPTTYDTQGNIVGARDMLKLYRDHYRRNIDSACILNETDKNFESLNRNFQINCYKDNLYFLPISFSRYHTVIVNGELVSPDRDIHDARLVVKLRGGYNEVVVYQPTYIKLLKEAFIFKNDK